MILKISEYSHIFAYTHIVRPRELTLDSTPLEYSHYSHRLSIWLVLFKYASNSKYSTCITPIVQIFWLMQVIWAIWVNTHITHISYASNSEYLLELFVLLTLFTWNIQVIGRIYLKNSNYLNYLYLCEYSTQILA